MTKDEVIVKIANNFNYVGTAPVIIVINELEKMGLIKFESEREIVIKDAQEYLKQDCIGPHTLIKRLVALLK